MESMLLNTIHQCNKDAEERVGSTKDNVKKFRIVCIYRFSNAAFMLDMAIPKFS